jgi:hypothetical protein
VVRYRTGDKRKASEQVVIASGARVSASLVAIGKTNWGQSECCEYISEVAFDESIRFGEVGLGICGVCSSIPAWRQCL